MRILIATDAFPPTCGGSGWSTWELATGLRARGHELTLVQPRPGQPACVRRYDGFEIEEFGAPAPRVPFLRNYFKNERLWNGLERWFRDIVRNRHIDLVHAQHVLTTPPAVAAARGSGVPVVATVRDYWPVCYWSDLIYDAAADTLCPACSAAMMTSCVRPRAGAAWPLALPLVPYMRRNLARKQARLADADAVIAVSSVLAADLVSRAAGIDPARVHVIPNPVDLDALRASVEATSPPAPHPYALYVGKLARNKGVDRLVPALARARLGWSIVIVGDGPARRDLEHDLRAVAATVRFTGWLPRPDTLRWLAHASVLLFPSRGPESLSRVLIEASALGVPIAAMNTGGTRDIVIDEHTGLLSDTAEELGEDLARLAGDPALCSRLGRAAREHVERTFSARVVIDRIEQLYERLAANHIAREVPSG